MADRSDPRAEDISRWFADFARLTKATRLYADNNGALVRILESAHASLTKILAEFPELVLSVRESHILFGKDEIYTNADREESIAFILYRNAFRRLTFLQGLTPPELLALARAVGSDHGGYVDGTEDLITVLWRLSLPHLRYLTIDALTVAASSSDLKQEEREEVERIQASVEDIVAAIYKTGAADDDIVAGVSISKEDLEALKEIRKEDQEDLDALDHATARALTEVPQESIDSIAQELATEDRDVLISRLVDILIEILFNERSGRSAQVTVDVVQRLFDSMILGRRFSSAAQLVEGLRGHAQDTENMQTMHVARQLLRMFSSEARVVPVLDSLDDRSSSVQDKVRFLRSLGPDTRPVLLDALDNLNLPGHRRLVCDLVREFGVPSVQELRQRMDGTQWFVVRDLLNLAQEYPLQEISALIAFALNHEHPKVRQHAVGLLRGYSRGLADNLLAERLQDEDLEVRLAAVRVAAARKSQECRPHLERILGAADFFDREVREIKIVTAAYAALVGVAAVPVLDKILNPGLLSQLRHTEAQVAAAFALASVGAPAKDALLRGSRTFNTRVREACKKALDQKERSADAAGSLKIPDASSSGKIMVPPAATTSTSELPRSRTSDLGTGINEAETFVGAMPSNDRTSLDEAPDFSLELPAIQEQVGIVGRKRPVIAQSTSKGVGVTDVLPQNLRVGIPEAPTTREILPPAAPIRLDSSALIQGGDPPPEEPTQIAVPPKPAGAAFTPTSDLPVTSTSDPDLQAALRSPATPSVDTLAPGQSADIPGGSAGSSDVSPPPYAGSTDVNMPAQGGLRPQAPPPNSSSVDIVPGRLPKIESGDLRPGEPPPGTGSIDMMPVTPPPSPSTDLRPQGVPAGTSSIDMMPVTPPPSPSTDLRPQGVPAASSSVDIVPDRLPPFPSRDLRPQGVPASGSSVDIMPERLPTRDLRAQGVPPSTSSSVDIMPGRLPPPPGGSAFTPPEKPKDPKVPAAKTAEEELKAYLTDDLIVEPADPKGDS